MIGVLLRARSGHRVAPYRTLAGDAEKAGRVERLEGRKSGEVEKLAEVQGVEVGLAVDREDAH
jgi:hypothetical protein